MSHKKYFVATLLLILLALALNFVSAASPPVDPVHQSIYLKFDNNPLYGENTTYVVDLSGKDFYENQTTENDTFGNFTGHAGNNFIFSPVNTTWTSGIGYYQSGAYLFFEKENPSYLENPVDGSLNISTIFTAAIWVNITDSNPSNEMGFFIQQENNQILNPPFYMGQAGNFRPRFLGFVNSSTSALISCSDRTFTQNTWGWFVVVGNGTHVRAYLDGLPCGSIVEIPDPYKYGNFANNGANWTIGIAKSGQSTSRSMNGTLDDLILWNNYSFTGDEVKTMYNNYVGVAECTNTPLTSPNATELGCEVRTNTSTSWNNQALNFSGSISLWKNLTIFNSSNILFNNSNFISSITGQNVYFNITNSQVRSTDNSNPAAVINIDAIGSFNILNSIISGFYQILASTSMNVIIKDSVISNGKQGLAWFTGENVSVINTTWSNSTNIYEGLKLKGYSNATNYVIENSTFENIAASCVFVYPQTGFRINGFRFVGNTLNNCSLGHGVAFPNNYGAYIAYNRISNVHSYGIDAYGNPFGCSNHLVERNNLTTVGNGVIFSCGGSPSTNSTSRWNRVINMTGGYAVYFNGMSNSTSLNDYVEGGNPVRCFGGVGTHGGNLIQNLTCKNLPQAGVLFGQSKNDVVDNVNLTNVSTDFFFTNNINITIRNSPINPGENLYGYARNETNLNLSNIGNKSFFIDNAGEINFNLTESYYYFKNIDESIQIISVLGLSDVLISYSDGVVETHFTGDTDLQLNANESVYIYDSFVSPIKLSGSGSHLKVSGSGAHFVLKA